MELTPTPAGYLNGLSETVVLEDAMLFPMLKSSDIGNGCLEYRKVMLVTQRRVGEDTTCIEAKAPRTWDYLLSHKMLLSKRQSKVYKNKPPFSIFGVGPYTFSPWKVAISGFYKQLNFVTVGPADNKPVVFDDTIYFLACHSEEEANFIEALLRSEAGQAFLHSEIHWDEKRPITAEILKCLNLQKLALMRGCEDKYLRFTHPPWI